MAKGLLKGTTAHRAFFWQGLALAKLACLAIWLSSYSLRPRSLLLTRSISSEVRVLRNMAFAMWLSPMQPSRVWSKDLVVYLQQAPHGQGVISTPSLAFLYFSVMAPRKPAPASTTGLDPGKIDEEHTGYLGASLIDEAELAKLVSIRVVTEEQAFASGKAVVPKPDEN
uniref:Uncharacterized protein n=1 Tax=Oryza sativa subsp. japonica TaxID=39947 RepID=Q6Z2S0_ORYSJ|nr:hypothetical protein [Oryza sativa Japonica Group]